MDRISRRLRWFGFILKMLRNANYCGSRKVLPGLRTIFGLLFVIGGIFGFLPILGFWMIPVGFLLISLDVPFSRKLVRTWLYRRKREFARGK
ncbi:MAG: hypothetical protein ISQ90_10365 [Rhodospirillales bacterium]|jgi:hypothetical protein|nr:hypothetical protein [Rhodospirillales bacterium]